MAIHSVDTPTCGHPSTRGESDQAKINLYNYCLLNIIFQASDIPSSPLAEGSAKPGVSYLTLLHL